MKEEYNEQLSNPEACFCTCTHNRLQVLVPELLRTTAFAGSPMGIQAFHPPETLDKITPADVIKYYRMLRDLTRLKQLYWVPYNLHKSGNCGCGH